METTCEEFLQVTDHNRVSASSEINIQPELRWPTQNVIEALFKIDVPVETISKFLRHESTVETLKYIGLNLDDMNEGMIKMAQYGQERGSDDATGGGAKHVLQRES